MIEIIPRMSFNKPKYSDQFQQTRILSFKQATVSMLNLCIEIFLHVPSITKPLQFSQNH
jgi:hypothetical protein